MIVCITAQGATFDAKVEERFGRAPYFIITDSETGSFESIANPYIDGSGGVGRKAAQLIIDHGVGVLICGLLGGNAKSVLDTAGIAQYVYHGGGTVRAALDAFRNNALDQVS